MKNLAVFLLLLAASVSNAKAQSIEIISLSGTVFCTGDSVDISYVATGNFTSRNSFTVQLSDQNGSFDKFFYNIGSKRTTNSGVIRFGVPQLDPSTQYRLRVISSEPYVVSSPYASFLRLGPKPIASATVASTKPRHLFIVMLDDTVRFQNTSQNASSFAWEFGPDAIPATSTDKDPLVRFTTPGLKHVSLTANSANGCSASWQSDNGQMRSSELMLTVVSCFPEIPSSAKVDSTSALENNSARDVWVVPGGVIGGHDELVNYYVEPGGTIQTNGNYCIFYLKAGAAYFGYYWRDVAIVFEDGAGMQAVREEQLIKCPDLEFDYSDAPPYKIQQSRVSRVRGSSIQVYPNPTTDRLTIEHKDNIIREITLRNTLGAEQLFMQPEGLGKTSIDVSHLAAGLYFLDLITDRGIETHKIVVE